MIRGSELLGGVVSSTVVVFERPLHAICWSRHGLTIYLFSDVATELEEECMYVRPENSHGLNGLWYDVW